MLSIIISYLQAKMIALGYVVKVFGLAESVSVDGKKFPAAYSGNELIHINLDNYLSCAYFARNGKVSSSTEDHPFIANAYQANEVYPFKLILYVQGVESVNCESNSQNIADAIKSQFTGRQRTFETESGVDFAAIEIKNTDLDKQSVWRDQFGIESVLKESDMLISIEFDFILKGNQACFVTDPCAGQPIAWDITCTSDNGMRVDHFYTDADVNSYVRPSLNGKTVVSVTYGNMSLIPTQWSKPTASSTIEFTDTAFPVESGTYVVVIYTS